MSTGADNKSLPNTPEYAEGYDRIFGKDIKPTRGTFIWDDAAKTFVPMAEHKTHERALDAPIMMDRFYENTAASDGTNIGSRRRHREYMKEHGLTTADDYKETWAKAEAERARIRKGEPMPDKERREQIGRMAYEVEKRGRRRK